MIIGEASMQMPPILKAAVAASVDIYHLFIRTQRPEKPPYRRRSLFKMLRASLFIDHSIWNDHMESAIRTPSGMAVSDFSIWHLTLGSVIASCRSKCSLSQALGVVSS